jgi:hypothetical protein
VFVTDQVSYGQSGMAGNSAVTFIPANNTEEDALRHEMAHQFEGDTRGLITAATKQLARIDRTVAGIVMLFPNAMTDYSNDFERLWMRTFESRSGVASHYPVASNLNAGAKRFQELIQPRTKPQ